MTTWRKRIDEILDPGRDLFPLAYEMAEEIDRLEKVFMEAPHDPYCMGWERLRRTDGTGGTIRHVDPSKCDCWKREALQDAAS